MDEHPESNMGTGLGGDSGCKITNTVFYQEQKTTPSGYYRSQLPSSHTKNLGGCPPQADRHFHSNGMGAPHHVSSYEEQGLYAPTPIFYSSWNLCWLLLLFTICTSIRIHTHTSHTHTHHFSRVLS